MFHKNTITMNISDYLSKQLQTGEDVVQVIRRHPATMFPAVGGGAMIVLVDFFFIAWWFKHQWGGIAFIIMVLLGILCIIRGVYIWSHNILAITNKRVIDIDQRGFFERNVSETTYDKVQDVRYTIRGFWPTILRFGTIVVQTAGTTTNLELDAVQHPVDVQRLITDLQQQSQIQPNQDVSASELLGVVEKLKAEIGEDGVARLLNKAEKKNNGHAQT